MTSLLVPRSCCSLPPCGSVVQPDIPGVYEQCVESTWAKLSDVYRRTWSQPQIAEFLRTGGHVMVASDWDVPAFPLPDPLIASSAVKNSVQGKYGVSDAHRVVWSKARDIVWAVIACLYRLYQAALWGSEAFHMPFPSLRAIIESSRSSAPNFLPYLRSAARTAADREWNQLMIDALTDGKDGSNLGGRSTAAKALGFAVKSTMKYAIAFFEADDGSSTPREVQAKHQEFIANLPDLSRGPVKCLGLTPEGADMLWMRGVFGCRLSREVCFLSFDTTWGTEWPDIPSVTAQPSESATSPSLRWGVKAIVLGIKAFLTRSSASSLLLALPSPSNGANVATVEQAVLHCSKALRAVISGLLPYFAAVGSSQNVISRLQHDKLFLRMLKRNKLL